MRAYPVDRCSVSNTVILSWLLALGMQEWRILVRHIVPNALGPAIVLSTMDFGNAIIITAALSFLGLGAVPPTPEWGAMVAEVAS